MSKLTIQEHVTQVIERARKTFCNQHVPTADELRANIRARSSRFRRRYIEPLVPLIEQSPEAEWLTVGDGWGQESFHLQEFHANVLATDIDTKYLSSFHTAGLIERYESQNIEKLTFGDRSFDYVMAKEMLHHLARPYLGIYEMLRVARKGVIIIEPQDPKVNEDLATQADGVREEFEAKIFGNLDFFFEDIGNYIYRFSAREFEKIAYGLGRSTIAFRGINDVGAFPTETDINVDDQAFSQLLQGLALKDYLSTYGNRRFEYLMTIIFIEEIAGELEESLRKLGWEVRPLLKNPYLYDQ